MATTVNYTYELQLCAPVTNSVNANCTAGSVANQIADDGSCLSFGSFAVATVNPNPYADGAFIAAYAGSAVNNYQAYMANIYVICAPTFAAPSFEHMKSDIMQAHFTLNSPVVC